MKLVCLNILGGKYRNDLLEFIREQDADVFCFQEVFSSDTNEKLEAGFYSGIFSDIKNVLPGFNSYSAPVKKGFDLKNIVDKDITFAQAVFVRKSFGVRMHGYEIVHQGREPVKGPKVDLPKLLQYIVLDNLAIFNFHGIASWPKNDTPERVEQSRRVEKIMQRFSGRKVLCGDFNIDTGTESLDIIGSGLKDLIKDFGIETTRPVSLGFEKRVSDYVFVSEGVRVKSFSVPDILVSDHLPLIVEFE